MKRKDLIAQIRLKKTFLCVGLDPDPARMPAHLSKDAAGVLQFCEEIIEATSPFCVAYKPNLAFFEAFGPEGMEVLLEVKKRIPDQIFTIADAKRGDIGNTAKMYARAYFETYGFDAITVAPYMGEDSIAPFLEFEDKWVILLGLTSNKGSSDFQQLESGGKKLYESVITRSQKWGNPDNLMFVVGATHPEAFQEIRTMARDYFFLVPGVGAQGGSLEGVIQNGQNADGGLLINSSRGIIYSGSGPDFARAAGQAARALSAEMAPFINF